MDKCSNFLIFLKMICFLTRLNVSGRESRYEFLTEVACNLPTKELNLNGSLFYPHLEHNFLVLHEVHEISI